MALDNTTRTAIELSNNAEELLAARLGTKLSPRAVSQATRKYLNDEVQPILDAADPFHISHNVLRRIERKGLSVRRGLSFRANMLEMSESRKLGVLRPSWVLDEKNKAYRFLDELSVRRPRSNADVYSFEELPQNTPAVVKATKSTGARGCYLLYSPNRIVHVRDNKTFNNWKEFRGHAYGLMQADSSTATSRALPDRWMVEELLLEDKRRGIAARDLKFYCFYGHIAFVRESIRGDDPRVRFYTPDNQPTETGREENKDFTPLGVTPEQCEIVSSISEAIPHPFMRIDMLNGEDGLVFGEFTPRPGNFDQFNNDWDRKMGEAWARAESRILEDLLQGKRFDAFLSATDLLDEK